MSETSEAPSTITTVPSKKIKLTQSTFTLNNVNIDLKDDLCRNWETRTEFSTPVANLSNDPFLHVELRNFVAEPNNLRHLRNQLDQVTFVEKSSDLFKFKQSNAIASISNNDIQSLREFFETSVLDFMKDTTRLPLNGKVDMFLSEYRRTDFLLCHDDELESRRIAFILYLSEEWSLEHGGSLDLFSSSEEIEPLKVVTSIVPAFNKFVFFNVTSRSFHQVSEVIDPTIRRLAVSGWFYGEPLPRPRFHSPVPESYLLKDHLTDQPLQKFFTEEYLSPSNYSAINASLEEYSIAKLKFLLRQEPYDELVKTLDDPTIQWDQKGPANLCCYRRPARLVLPISNELPPALSAFLEVFFSHKFFQFLESVTEFTLDEICHVTPALRRFQHKSYILLKTIGDEDVNQEGHGEGWEIIPDDSDDDEGDDHAASKISNGTTPCNEEAGTSNTGPGVTVGSEDVGTEDDEDPGDDENSEREIDVIYYFGDFTWDESFGGQTVYADSTGQQLLTVTPEPNTMAIVVREKGVIPYVSYINCLSGTQQFHSLTLTLSGFKDTE